MARLVIAVEEGRLELPVARADDHELRPLARELRRAVRPRPRRGQGTALGRDAAAQDDGKLWRVSDGHMANGTENHEAPLSGRLVRCAE